MNGALIEIETGEGIGAVAIDAGTIGNKMLKTQTRSEISLCLFVTE